MTAGSAALGRGQTYARLQWRNRLISLLRWAMPLLIAAALALFAGRLWLAGLEGSAAGVRLSLDRGALIIDTPHYEGVTADGTRYSVTAREGETVITAPDVLKLHDARLELQRADGVRFFAQGALAYYDLVAQTVKVPGQLAVRDSRGSSGVLENAAFDWSTQMLKAKDGARLEFSDGTEITGQTLAYDAAKAHWMFEGAQMQTGSQ